MHGTIPSTTEEALGHVAEALGVDASDLPASTVADCAPPDDPERMNRTAELSGAAIRAACDSAAEKVRALAAEAEARAATIRKDAEAFAASVCEIGDAHAKRIEKALLGMKSTLAIIEAERVKVTTFAD
ncbi:MAG: hypothetical protein IT537_08595 [Hyphomicrobiales bacterium]|nr:hypothetical protein [Hyphomicrobiales bacterium]